MQDIEIVEQCTTCNKTLWLRESIRATPLPPNKDDSYESLKAQADNYNENGPYLVKYCRNSCFNPIEIRKLDRGV